MTALQRLLAVSSFVLLALPASADDPESAMGGAAHLNPCAAKALNPCAAKTLNPCAAKTLNPCAAKTSNPCAAKTLNPCAAKSLNPCAAKPVKSNPCGAANPCGGNPCGAAKLEAERFKQPSGTALAGGNPCSLVKRGEQLWNDRGLGKSGLACATCHQGNYGQMNASFAEPYPHRVAMPHQQAGVDAVSAAEMVNFCMIVPMQDEPLAWESEELAALAAWVEHIQAGFEPTAAAANPCNPCGAKNPCNPCGAR